MGKRWLPLESNPDVLNSFAKGLGFDTTTYAFCDIFGLDEVQLSSGVLTNACPRCHSSLMFHTRVGAPCNGAPACPCCATSISSHR